MNELLQAIFNKKEMHHEVNGKKYVLELVRVLDTPLGQLMALVSEGKLFYDDAK